MSTLEHQCPVINKHSYQYLKLYVVVITDIIVKVNQCSGTK